MIPIPSELGLPSKFKEWRKHQWPAVQDGLQCKRRFAVQVQRAGMGKTLVYMTQGLLSEDSRVVVLTQTRGLQDQLLEDWAGNGLVDVRGKSSYQCDVLPGRNCEEGSLGRCMYTGSSMCGHTNAVKEARQARLLTTNYSCWTSSYKYGQGFGDFDLMICDEAHAAPAEVAKSMQIQLSLKEMEYLERDWPIVKDSMDTWKDWAKVTYPLADRQVQKLKLEIDGNGKPPMSAVLHYRHMRNLARKLADLATCKPEHWVISDWLYGYQFDVIEPGVYAERMLFRGIPKVILTSGTVRPKTLEMLGIGPKEFEFFDYPGEITPSRSPLIHLNTRIRVNKNTPDWEYKQLTRNWIDKIIEGRLDRKGIIHTANFRVRDHILSFSKFDSRVFITNYGKDGPPTSDVIARYKAMKPPAVLISPSVSTGYDFPYDDCRYQIIAKMPWPDIGSKVEQARNGVDPTQSAYQMVQTLAQAFGRGDRAEDDWQEVFVVDDNFGRVMWAYRDLAPTWMAAYIRRLDSVPPPLNLEDGE